MGRGVPGAGCQRRGIRDAAWRGRACACVCFRTLGPRPIPCIPPHPAPVVPARHTQPQVAAPSLASLSEELASEVLSVGARVAAELERMERGVDIAALRANEFVTHIPVGPSTGGRTAAAAAAKSKSISALRVGVEEGEEGRWGVPDGPAACGVGVFVRLEVWRSRGRQVGQGHASAPRRGDPTPLTPIPLWAHNPTSAQSAARRLRRRPSWRSTTPGWRPRPACRSSYDC
jgi:hypothetical protein